MHERQNTREALRNTPRPPRSPVVAPDVAVKALDKAIEAAAGNNELRRALESARAIMGEQLVRMGLRGVAAAQRQGGVTTD